MAKRILVNGAGRGCLNLTKTAKDMGLYVVVTGMDGPCISLADKAYRNVHPGHPEEVLDVAKAEKVDAVVTCCNDMGLESVAYCCEQLHLTGLSYDSAKACQNKYLMKELLVKHDVRTARFFLVHNQEELVSAANKLSLPVIIKATDLQGSRGISIVRDRTILQRSFDDVMSMTHKDYCIVEEYIEGTEFGAQAFVYHGEVLFVLPHGDETVMCQTAVPVGHYMPYEMNDSLSEDVQAQARKAIKAIGLDNCAVNIDFIERDNKAYIIELTGRGGANGLTDITGLYLGINYYQMIIQMALGTDPRNYYNNRFDKPHAALSRMLKSSYSGVLKSLSVPPAYSNNVSFFIKEGDYIHSFTNCNDALGEVIIGGEDLLLCQKFYNQLINSIVLHIE